MKEIARLFNYTKNLRKYVFIAGFTAVVSALLSMATPLVIKLATDAIVEMNKLGQFEAGYLWMLIGGLAAVFVIDALVSFWGGRMGDIMSIKMRRQLSEGYYRHLMTLPQQYYDEANTGKIINRLNRAITDITQFVNGFANNMLQMLLTISISIAILAWYNPALAVVIILQIPLYLHITARTSKKWQAIEKKKNTLLDKASGRFAEVVGQIRLVKSFGTAEREIRSFEGQYAEVVTQTKKQSKHWHISNFLRLLVQAVVYCVVFMIIFTSAAKGLMTIGDMVLIITLVQQTNFPLRNISFFFDMFQRAVANSRDYEEAMQEEPEVVDEHGKKELDAKNAKIEYRDVDFAYGKEKKVLHEISFTIDAGTKLALVGESGGGKSTLANLLMRLYEPVKGGVYINDVNISDVTQLSLRSQIATVFQDAALFSGTLRENIAYAKPHATEEELVAAAKAANAYDFIKELDKGFETEVGERGIKLSGGQKQRISIARAVLKDAPILILDEATSALDSRSEQVVQDALDKLMKGRTVLIIAHRLSTIADVDTIVTLKKGKIDEIGSPAELSKTDGIYSQLLELQTGMNEQTRRKLKEYDMS